MGVLAGITTQFRSRHLSQKKVNNITTRTNSIASNQLAKQGGGVKRIWMKTFSLLCCTYSCQMYCLWLSICHRIWTHMSSKQSGYYVVPLAAASWEVSIFSTKCIYNFRAILAKIVIISVRRTDWFLLWRKSFLTSVSEI